MVATPSLSPFSRLILPTEARSNLEEKETRQAGGEVDVAPPITSRQATEGKCSRDPTSSSSPSAPIRTPRRRSVVRTCRWLPWPLIAFLGLAWEALKGRVTSFPWVGRGCLRGGCNRFGWGRRRAGSSFSSASLHCRRVPAWTVVGEEPEPRCRSGVRWN